MSSDAFFSSIFCISPLRLDQEGKIYSKRNSKHQATEYAGSLGEKEVSQLNHSATQVVMVPKVNNKENEH